MQGEELKSTNSIWRKVWDVKSDTIILVGYLNLYSFLYFLKQACLKHISRLKHLPQNPYGRTVNANTAHTQYFKQENFDK